MTNHPDELRIALQDDAEIMRELLADWPRCARRACGNLASYYAGNYPVCRSHGEMLKLGCRLDPIAIPLSTPEELVDKARFEVLEDRRFTEDDDDDGNDGD